MIEDRSGLLWIGTEGGGISILNPATATFHHYTADPTQPQGMHGRIVTALYADHAGKLWVGTDGNGLNVIDRAAGVVRTYRNDPNNPHSLSAGAVNAVFEDSDGAIWIATAHGLNRFDQADELVHRISPTVGFKHGELGNDVVEQIVEDAHGHALAWHRGWPQRLRSGVGRFVKTYRSNADDPTSISGNHISVLTATTTARSGSALGAQG